MKVIAADKISTVTASSEASGYDADNVLDNHPKKIWKGTGTQEQLSCDVASFSGDTAGIAIFNTNASSLVVNISDPNELLWPDNDWPVVVWVYSEISATVTLESSGTTNSVWGEWENVETAMVVDINFTASENVYAGVVRIGAITEFNNPQYGMQQGLKNYSLEAELSNGAIWTKDRDVVRTFSGRLLEERDTNFYTFMHTLARSNSYNPFAMRLTDVDSFEWVVFGRFATMPMGSHVAPRHSTIDFYITEVI